MDLSRCFLRSTNLLTSADSLGTRSAGWGQHRSLLDRLREAMQDRMYLLLLRVLVQLRTEEWSWWLLAVSCSLLCDWATTREVNGNVHTLFEIVHMSLQLLHWVCLVPNSLAGVGRAESADWIQLVSRNERLHGAEVQAVASWRGLARAFRKRTGSGSDNLSQTRPGDRQERRTGDVQSGFVLLQCRRGRLEGLVHVGCHQLYIQLRASLHS